MLGPETGTMNVWIRARQTLDIMVEMPLVSALLCQWPLLPWNMIDALLCRTAIINKDHCVRSIITKIRHDRENKRIHEEDNLA